MYMFLPLTLLGPDRLTETSPSANRLLLYTMEPLESGNETMSWNLICKATEIDALTSETVMHMVFAIARLLSSSNEVVLRVTTLRTTQTPHMQPVRLQVASPIPAYPNSSPAPVHQGLGCSLPF